MKDETRSDRRRSRWTVPKYRTPMACTGGELPRIIRMRPGADQMLPWLIEQGLDPARIIVENKSSSTVENAEFTYRILRESYPQIDSLALITAIIIFPRGCLLYNARLLLSAYEARGDHLLTIDNNAGYQAGRSEGYESIMACRRTAYVRSPGCMILLRRSAMAHMSSRRCPD